MTDSRQDVGTSFAAPFVIALGCAVSAGQPVLDGEAPEARVRRIRDILRRRLMMRDFVTVHDLVRHLDRLV